MMNRSILALVVVAFLCVAARPQLPVPDDKSAAEERERRIALAEEIVSDAAGLRLGENRAFVLARVGTLIFKDDRKSALGHFQRAIGELTGAQLSAEAEDKGKPGSIAQQLARNARPTILSMIGGCDAEFALDALYRTRTPGLLRDLTEQPDVSGKIGSANSPGSDLARTELYLEQQLARLAAEQNPELAVKFIQDSIKKGLSGETLGLLKRLNAKDPESAASLAAEAMERLLSASFSTDASDRNNIALAAAILNDNIRPRRLGVKDLAFDDTQLRTLAGKYIAHSIAQSNRFPMGGNLTQALRFAEKFSPASVAALRKLQRDRLPPGVPNMMDPEVRRLTDSKLTPAQMLAEARKLPVDSRSPIYQNAATKMASSGDHAGAMAMLNANLAGRSLEMAINNLNWNYAGLLMNQGKWQDAENLIDQFPDDNRRAALIDLAKKAFEKDREANRDMATGVLKKARSQFPDRPTDQLLLAQFFQLAAAFAPIEADEAFNVYELVIPVINELADANAVVSGFRSDSSVRSGEYVLSTSTNFGFQIEPAALRALAKADASRTSKMLDRFTRREIKVAMRLQIADPERR